MLVARLCSAYEPKITASRTGSSHIWFLISLGDRVNVSMLSQIWPECSERVSNVMPIHAGVQGGPTKSKHEQSRLDFAETAMQRLFSCCDTHMRATST